MYLVMCRVYQLVLIKFSALMINKIYTARLNAASQGLRGSAHREALNSKRGCRSWWCSRLYALAVPKSCGCPAPVPADAL